MQFPLDQPIPYDLITRIVVFRAQEKPGQKPLRKNCGYETLTLKMARTWRFLHNVD